MRPFRRVVRPGRVGALLAVLAAATGCGLPGFTEADRAVSAAPGCDDAGAARVAAPVVEPGRVVAWRPHFLTAGLPAEPHPREIPGWDDVVSVAGSGATTAAVHADGTVSIYGQGHLGSLGDGDAGDHRVLTPQPVPGVRDARSVHNVGSAFFVVHHDGTVTAWGDRFLAHGGVRDGGQRAEPSPVPLGAVSDVAAIAPGSLYAVGLTGDGAVVGWGIALGRVFGDRDGTGAGAVRTVRGAVSIAAAGPAVVTATATGAVCAWGNNVHGVLGAEPTGGETGRAVRVPGLDGVVQVAGGGDVAFALDAAGTVYAWGRGVHGVLGDGDVTDHVAAVPRPVPGLPPVRWIGAQGLTGLAIDVEGRLWAWGSPLALPESSPGRFADGPQPVPVPIPLPGPAVAVSGMHVILGPGEPPKSP